MSNFNGLGMNMGNLSLLSKAKSRSISAENKTGEKGKGGMAFPLETSCARELGQGWKASPHVIIKSGETVEITDIDGPGAIQQMWMTPTGNRRFTIIRIYWDNQDFPSVECPIGDFFCNGWGNQAWDGNFLQISSLAVCVNPGSAYNCHWEMPFKKNCRITIENIDSEEMRLFYQINYTLTDVPDNAAYFHAQFRRTNPIPYKDVYTIVDGIKGEGQYVGTYLAHGVNSNGWWGEGEIKFYMDGDTDFPTICGTGEEDYFCGSYDFLANNDNGKYGYKDFSTPYSGFHQVNYKEPHDTQRRFSMYRWHVTDPIRFESDLKITMQVLGWKSEGRYRPLQDDIASVAFWYQTLPAEKFPVLPEKDFLEIN